MQAKLRGACAVFKRGEGEGVARALALAGLASSSGTDRRTATERALRDGLASFLLLSVGAAASAPPSTSGSGGLAGVQRAALAVAP